MQFLEGVALSPAMVAAATRRAAARRSDPDHDHARPPPAQGIPLINGRALAVAYLEWLVSHGPHGPAGAKSSNGASGGGGGAPPGLHDEYAQLLMEGIPFDVDGDAINRASRGGPAGEGEGVWEARPEVRPSPYSSLRYSIFFSSNVIVYLPHVPALQTHLFLRAPLAARRTRTLCACTRFTAASCRRTWPRPASTTPSASSRYPFRAPI